MPQQIPAPKFESATFYREYGHFMKNALGRIQTIHQNPDLKEEQDVFGGILTNSLSQIDEMTTALVMLHRLKYDDIIPEEVDVETLLLPELKTLASNYGKDKVVHKFYIREAKVCPQLILFVMEEMVKNALEFSLEGSEVRFVIDEEDGFLVLSTENEALPISPLLWKEMGKFFCPTSTKKSDQKGAGVGMATLSYAATKLGGEMTIDQEETKTEVMWKIPYLA